MTPADPTERPSVIRLVLGAILLVGGVVVWIATDTPWLGGLISGVGVVVGYTALSATIERWRVR